MMSNLHCYGKITSELQDMQRLREKAIARIVSCILTLCLGIVIVSPAARADVSDVDYGDWLRLHLPGAMPSHVQRAILLASQREARSFNEFLTSFGEELEALSRVAPGSDPAVPADESTESWLLELRFEYARFVGDALLYRTNAVISAPSSTNETQARSDLDCCVDNPVRLIAFPSAWNDSGNRLGGHSGTFKFSASQPLGP